MSDTLFPHLKKIAEDNKIIIENVEDALNSLEYKLDETYNVFKKSIISKNFNDFSYDITVKLHKPEKGYIDIIISVSYGNVDLLNRFFYNDIIICGEVLHSNIDNIRSYVLNKLTEIETLVLNLENNIELLYNHNNVVYVNNKCFSQYETWCINNNIYTKHRKPDSVIYDDGITQLEKYLFGINPKTSASYSDSGLFKIYPIEENSKIVFEYPVIKNKEDVITIFPQVSNNLLDWSNIDSTNIQIDNKSNNKFDIFKVTINVDIDTDYYFRLVIGEFNYLQLPIFGAQTFKVHNNDDLYLAPKLHQLPIFTGKVAKITDEFADNTSNLVSLLYPEKTYTNIIVFGDSDKITIKPSINPKWKVNKFIDRKYYVLFTSGKLEGGWFDIISNTENELEISIRRHDKLNLSLNDTFEIIQHYTISELLKYGINVNPQKSNIEDIKYNKYFSDLEQNTGIKHNDPEYQNLTSASFIEFQKHDTLTGVQMSTSVNYPNTNGSEETEEDIRIHSSTYNHVNIWENGDYVSLNSEKTDIITLNDSICAPYYSIMIRNGTTKGDIDNHMELGSIILCGTVPNHCISYEYFYFIENVENSETQKLDIRIKQSHFNYGIPSLTDIPLLELNDNDWIGIDKFVAFGILGKAIGDMLYVRNYTKHYYSAAADDVYRYRISSNDPNTQYWVRNDLTTIANTDILKSKDVFTILFRIYAKYDSYKIGRLSFKPNYVK